MNNKEIYELFDKIGCLTFTTVSDGIPHSRIAHFNGFDENGFYFRTMVVKPFYRHLVNKPVISICGLYPDSKIDLDPETGLPYFKPGYFIRLIGEVRPVPADEIREKAETNLHLKSAAHDLEAYPAMSNFCLYRGRGEVFDYDFEMEHRDHKLLRTRFSFGGGSSSIAGCRITDKCISCGQCIEECTFKAIKEASGKYEIIPERCDACGSCSVVCPADAIEAAEDL